jgi:uncharacterized membrane-anchored protein YhcB (DUF1043 family)
MDVEWIVATVAIFLAGAGLGFFLGAILRKGDNAKLADTEAELAAYKREVTEHFGQSAEHFQAIGSHYRKLYEHMAAGSEKLCDPVEADTDLKFPRPAEVAIEASAPDRTSTDEAPDARAEEPTEDPTEDKPPSDYAEGETPDEDDEDDSDKPDTLDREREDVKKSA